MPSLLNYFSKITNNIGYTLTSNQDVYGEKYSPIQHLLKKLGWDCITQPEKKLLWLTAPPFDLHVKKKLNDCPVPRRKHFFKDILVVLKMGSGAHFIYFLQRSAGLYTLVLLLRLKAMSVI